VVADNPTLAAMMATRSYSLPVAGEVTNTNTLLGQDGFVGMKTGSDDAAGGCFMFRSERHTDRGDVTLIGVVLGQQGHNLITAELYAAKQLADRMDFEPMFVLSGHLLVDEAPLGPKPCSRLGSLLSVDTDPGRDQDLHI
jgi:hypothetical protein